MDAATILRRIRASSGVTRRDVARLAGLSPSTIGRIESGTLDPTWGTLRRILDATGFSISGNTVVSSGDVTAAVAARRQLERALDSLRPRRDGIGSPDMAPLSPQALPRPPGSSIAMTSLPDTSALDSSVTAWLDRWSNAGWLTESTEPEGLIRMATAAGNASKITRREVPQRYVGDRHQWQQLARQLGMSGIEYVVSGLLAVRDDRTTATSLAPLIYVTDLDAVMRVLELEDSSPGRGVLLVEAAGAELEGSDTEDGIRFASEAQAVLDALAGAGREPDKADDILRSMLEAGA